MEGRYPYIPIDPHIFYKVCSFIKKYLEVQIKKNGTNNCFRFLEIGCGPGVNLLMLLSFLHNNGQNPLDRYVEFHGLEITKEDCETAKKLCSFNSLIINQDALTFNDYSSYDFIYYYCPFCDPEKEQILENLIEEKCKVGCIILSCLKRDRRIEKDKRFTRLYGSDDYVGFSIWQKVKDRVDGSSKNRRRNSPVVTAEH